MNPNTGELMRLADGEKPPSLFERITDQRLEMLARLKMDREPAAVVNLNSRSPLAEWAKKKRKEKLAAKSRRRNRK